MPVIRNGMESPNSSRHPLYSLCIRLSATSRMQLPPFILIQSFHLVAKMHQKDVAQLQPVS